MKYVCTIVSVLIQHYFSSKGALAAYVRTNVFDFIIQSNNMHWQKHIIMSMTIDWNNLTRKIAQSAPERACSEHTAPA